MFNPEIASMAGWSAGLITFFGYIPYLIAILKNKTKPHRTTWIVLAAVGMMLMGSYYALGAKETIWVPLGYVIGPLVIVFFSIRRGEGGWSKFDLMCLGAAITTGFLWLIFDTPFLVLSINLLIDWFGLMPTVRKAYHRPHTEDRLAWGLWLTGSTLNLFAIEHWTLKIVAYPLYMFLGNSIIAFLVCYPRKKFLHTLNKN